MDYVLGSTNRETERLDIQSKIFETSTLETLKRAGIKNGMRCLDLGCGTGGTTMLMAKLLGKRGHVTGIDYSADRIRICKRRAYEKHRGNLEFLRGNVYDTKFEDSTFDFIVSRFLFQHLKDPVKALQEMKRISRKGGIIVTEEFAYSSWLTYPLEPKVDRLRKSYMKLARLHHLDPLIARNLYRLFLRVGLRPNIEAYAVCVPMQNNFYKIVTLLAEVIRGDLIKNTISSKTEFNEMHERLEKFAENPNGHLLYTLALRVWSKN